MTLEVEFEGTYITISPTGIPVVSAMPWNLFQVLEPAFMNPIRDSTSESSPVIPVQLTFFNYAEISKNSVNIKVPAPDSGFFSSPWNPDIHGNGYRIQHSPGYCSFFAKSFKKRIEAKHQHLVSKKNPLQNPDTVLVIKLTRISSR